MRRSPYEEECIMKLWSKKETIDLFSESQKDNMLERLEKAHVNYQIREVDDLFSFGRHYSISVNAADMNKVA